MTEYRVSIDRKFFEPIRNKDISLLIFDKQVIPSSYEEGDKIITSFGEYQVSDYIKRCYIKSFGDITEDEAKKAGFLNKDFLKDDLANRFKIDGIELLINGIREKLLFLIELEETPDSSNIDLYQNTTLNYSTWGDDEYEEF